MLLKVLLVMLVMLVLLVLLVKMVKLVLAGASISSDFGINLVFIGHYSRRYWAL